MQDNDSQPTVNAGNRLPRWLPPYAKYVFLALLILAGLSAVLGLFVLPEYLRGRLEAELSESLQKKVTIENASLDAVPLALQLENLRVSDGQGFKRLYVQLALSHVFAKTIFVEKLVLESPEIRPVEKMPAKDSAEKDIKQGADEQPKPKRADSQTAKNNSRRSVFERIVLGFFARVTGIDWQQSESHTQQAVKTGPAKSTNGKSNQAGNKKTKADSSASMETNEAMSGWRVHLADMLVVNTKLYWQQKTIAIPELKLKRLSYPLRNSEQTDLQLQARMGDASLSVQAKLSNLAAEPVATADIRLQKLALSDLNSITPDTKAIGLFDGQVAADISVAYDKGNVDLKGSIGGESLAVWSADNKKVLYATKNLQVKKMVAAIKGENINLKAGAVEISNLHMSVPAKQYQKGIKVSGYEAVRLDNVTVQAGANENIQAELTYNKTGKIRYDQKKTRRYLDKKLTVKGLDLTPLSQIIESSLNYRVASGQVNVDLKMRERNGKVDGKAMTVLSQLDLDTEKQTGEEIKNDSSIPFATAVAMIRDDEGKIELEIDIDGSADDPDFGFLPMIRSGIGSFLISKITELVATKAAEQFLPMLLSSIPLSPGNTFMLVSGVYKFVSKPRFADILFRAGSVEIKPDSFEQIDKVAEFLKDNKAFSFKFCPVVTMYEAEPEKKENADQDEDQADNNRSKNDAPARPAMSQEAALDLARQRIEVLKQQLQQRKVNAEQTVFCRPKIEDARLNQGQIEISI